MKVYFKPLFFSFIPSLIVIIATLIISFDWSFTMSLLMDKTSGSVGFRTMLLIIEIVSYFILLRYFQKQSKKIVFEEVAKNIGDIEYFFEAVGAGGYTIGRALNLNDGIDDEQKKKAYQIFGDKPLFFYKTNKPNVFIVSSDIPLTNKV